MKESWVSLMLPSKEMKEMGVWNFSSVHFCEREIHIL
jgi:hypothetical protein